MNPVLQVSKIRGSIDTATVRKTSIDSNVSSPRNSINGSNGFGFNALTSAIPDFNNLPVQELLKIITSRVVYYFSMSTNDIENMVPDIVYVESILRRIKLLIGIHFSSSMEDIVKERLHLHQTDHSRKLKSSTRLTKYSCYKLLI